MMNLGGGFDMYGRGGLGAAVGVVSCTGGGGSGGGAAGDGSFGGSHLLGARGYLAPPAYRPFFRDLSDACLWYRGSTHLGDTPTARRRARAMLILSGGPAAIGSQLTITSMLHHTLHLQALGLGSLECQWFASF